MFKKFIALTLLSTSSLTTHANPPEHVALVDTGYDQCIQSGGVHCEQNKNLLFRGGVPLPDDAPFDFNFADFRSIIFDALTDFNTTFFSRAALPHSLDDLKNYRIVDIDLIYDFNEAGDQYELTELQNEFKDSGHSKTLQIPEQHVMYGLTTPFNTEQFAFEWWPVTFAELSKHDPQFVSMNLNWPDRNGTPFHAFLPQEYKPLDFPLLISGIAIAGDNEPAEAKDLVTLLKTIPEDGHPLLIFYHCIGGKDRTGAVSAAYFMQHGGYPYFATVQSAQKQMRQSPTDLASALHYTILPDRTPNQGSIGLSTAYCLSLKNGAAHCKL